ncbi:hypothetical protein NC653_038019 [Populus alba x Populus x berolinensis]|uniref:EF-hand domain-containing protein n=1 Tax=Populus alba x Populus x berolinensis TaxID=444605 RepID=A0AAD6PSN5_9ROSI|nr:hypothetical protein NC653_038019 [Populus alba x Populus x berolinensis]
MATTESLVAQIQGLSSNAVDLGLLSIHLKKADEVLHNESTRLLAFLEQLDPTLHSLGNLVFPFWRMIFLMLISHGNFFSIVIMGDTQDYNEDGKLSFSEFSDLIKAFGNQKEELFKAADKNGDDAVSMDELAELPAFQQEKWMFKLSEWAHFSSYDVGLNSGSSASHILVKETLLVAREGRVWCLEDRLVLGGFDWDPTLQEKACWSRRPFDRDSDSDFEVFELFDPAATGKVVGRISLSCSVEDPMETEKNFARCILAIVDYNEDGKLSFSEFSDLIKAFGNQKEELFKAADKNGVDAVSMDELAELPAFQQENEPLINCCPVCGEILEVSNKLNTLVHLSLCFDERTRNQVMTGGFLTDKQASYGWMFKLSEWAHFSSYDVGLNSGSSASHILVMTAPMSSINAIAVEAFKKYILVSLIQNSQFSTSLPKCTSSAAQRNLKTLCQPYMEVASSYSSGKVSELETYIQTNRGEDNNLGLVKQVISSMIMTLSKKLNAVDELLSCDPLYLAKAGRERQRFDFDDFDPVSQKFNI